MLLSRRDFRAIIFYEFARGTSLDSCRLALLKVFACAAPSRAVIEKCYGEFKRSKDFFEEEEQEGKSCPRVITTEYVDGVRRMVKADPRVQREEVEEVLRIGSTATRKILDEYLQLRKRLDCWVPKVLSDEQKEDRLKWCRLIIKTFDNGLSPNIANVVTGGELWIYRYEDDEKKDTPSNWGFAEDDDQAPKSKSTRITGKRMIGCFFSKSGYVATVPLDKKFSRATVDWMINTCLPKVMAVFNSRSSEKRELIIHHDRTQVITAAKTISFIHKSEARLFPHPFHSPDLNPCDYFLFPAVRQALRGRRFGCAEELFHAFQDYVDGLTEEVWAQAFSEWFLRIRKCRKNECEYLDDS